MKNIPPKELSLTVSSTSNTSSNLSTNPSNFKQEIRYDELKGKCVISDEYNKFNFTESDNPDNCKEIV